MSAVDISMWNKEDAEILKAKYILAVGEGKDKFTIMGQEVLVTYCMYLIEHLENQGILEKDI